MWYSKLEKKKKAFPDISSTNSVPSLYQCVETRSIQVFWLLSQPLPHLRFNVFVISEVFATFLGPVVNRLRDWHFSPQRGNVLWICFALSTFAHENAHQNAAFGITLLKYGRHFDYRNQPLNVRMRARYLYCNEIVMPCHLVIHTEDLLHPLELFYFYLWPIYWLSLVNCI
jgi:hypothetical protein